VKLVIHFYASTNEKLNLEIFNALENSVVKEVMQAVNSNSKKVANISLPDPGIYKKSSLVLPDENN
jgi:hypothetical protein